MDKATLTKILVDADSKRARTQQTAIGVSSLATVGVRFGTWLEAMPKPTPPSPCPPFGHSNPLRHRTGSPRLLRQPDARNPAHD